jgi:hypothetical protein
MQFSDEIIDDLLGQLLARLAVGIDEPKCSDFITKEGYAIMLGLVGPEIDNEKPTLLDGWIKRHWQKHQQYVVIGNTLFIHIPSAEQWLKNHGHLASVQQHQAQGLKSSSGTRARESILKRSQATRTLKSCLQLPTSAVVSY